MNKFQAGIRFSCIEDFLNFLPQNQLTLVEGLRSIINECIPEVHEKLSYNVLYFRKRKNICFLWPAAIPWGGFPVKDGIQLGFVNGYLLGNEDGFLEQGTRKKVSIKQISTLKDLDMNRIKSLLYEAELIDKEI